MMLRSKIKIDIKYVDKAIITAVDTKIRACIPTRSMIIFQMKTETIAIKAEKAEAEMAAMYSFLDIPIYTITREVIIRKANPKPKTHATQNPIVPHFIIMRNAGTIIETIMIVLMNNSLTCPIP